MAAELCDGCRSPVRALFRVRLPSGRAIFYCGHHTTLYVDKLMELGAFIYRIGEP